MYRSGFTIDNGPFRRLDDPSNADFLRDLARGVTPRELFETNAAEDGEGNDNANARGDMEVGLVDKRHMEYEEDTNRTGAASSSSTSASTPAPAAFSGVGQSLGSSSSTPASSAGGIIEASTSDTTVPPPVDETKPTTTIQIRLLSGKRLIVKCNLDDPVRTLVLHINASGGGKEDYVLSSGYPPRVLSDLSKTIQECGLKGAQVMQKKA